MTDLVLCYSGLGIVAVTVTGAYLLARALPSRWAVKVVEIMPLAATACSGGFALVWGGYWWAIWVATIPGYAASLYVMETIDGGHLRFGDLRRAWRENPQVRRTLIQFFLVFAIFLLIAPFLIRALRLDECLCGRAGHLNG